MEGTNSLICLGHDFLPVDTGKNDSWRITRKDGVIFLQPGWTRACNAVYDLLSAIRISSSRAMSVFRGVVFTENRIWYSPTVIATLFRIRQPHRLCRRALQSANPDLVPQPFNHRGGFTAVAHSRLRWWFSATTCAMSRVNDPQRQVLRDASGVLRHSEGIRRAYEHYARNRATRARRTREIAGTRLPASGATQSRASRCQPRLWRHGIYAVPNASDVILLSGRVLPRMILNSLTSFFCLPALLRRFTGVPKSGVNTRLHLCLHSAAGAVIPAVL